MSKFGLKIEFGPTYSPWSNGINERNHYSADIVVRKVREMDQKLSLQCAVEMAAWTHNTNVSFLGYEPMRLVTGKSVCIPGVTVGDQATDSLFDSDAVQKIMDRHYQFMKRFREHEYGDKIKRAGNIRSNEINNRYYVEGDEVFFQEMDKKAWLGPVKVFCHRGRDVYLFVNGNIRKVASCKVKPFKTASESDKDECDDKVDCKKGKTVTIELGENVLEADNIEEKFEDDLISVEKDRVDVEKDTVGSFWMLVENNECYNYEITSYVVELLSHQHKKPEVIDAKQIELKNLQD